jgi:hypothetical protein
LHHQLLRSDVLIAGLKRWGMPLRDFASATAEEGGH